MFENNLEVPQKLNRELPYYSKISILGKIPKELKNMSPQTLVDKYPEQHPNSQKVEAIQMSIN